jgi:hypothetical protein
MGTLRRARFVVEEMGFTRRTQNVPTDTGRYVPTRRITGHGFISTLRRTVSRWVSFAKLAGLANPSVTVRECAGTLRRT